jgi:hypothetical protein
MSTYPYPWHSCKTPLDLDLYPFVQKRKLKNVDAEFQVKVEYYMSINHLQDYKIYVTLTKMFISKFLSSLPQPLGDNPWPEIRQTKISKHDFIGNVIIFWDFKCP